MTSEDDGHSMIPPNLPAELKSALARKLEGLSRNGAAARAALISQTYREGGTSRGIRDQIDALAYALARMPATYAAVVASLNALREVRPDLAPATLFDIGAGPGTASWAAAAAFPSLANFTLFDDNDALRTLALELAQGNSRLANTDYRKGNAVSLVTGADCADLIIASYVVGELAERERSNLADLAWRKTRDTLLIVEPGTPAGYQRILALRDQMIAAGAHVAAPCPHQAACPLVAADWCHFAQRLPRTRAHKAVKGAEVPFEDEKFIYLALTRHLLAYRPAARVLTPPHVGKVEVTAKLCRADGASQVVAVPRRDKGAYALARRWAWGDAVEPGP
jgi:ribosomal protein RSM22 (predicted rRNA methylase)